MAATSGQNVGGLAFGDFKLVTYSGTVYNDLNGNGVMDSGEPTLKGWTINLLNSIGTVVVFGQETAALDATAKERLDTLLPFYRTVTAAAAGFALKKGA